MKHTEDTMPAAPFSLRLDAETRARLEEEARRLDRPAAQVAARAIVRWLDAQAALRAEIDAAVAEADAGVFVSAEAMHAWMETWDSETTPPEPDIRP
jgi:predicted transcriptional regulator